MRLLVCTQKVDKNDDVLGFFHGWLLEFAKHFSRVTVICLEEGAHDLPSHVRVFSLGKERHCSRPRPLRILQYIGVFVRNAVRMRKEYDAVFVHMNQEYVLLGGLLWRLLRKKVVLWRNHAKGNALTRLAVAFADAVCHTSPKAYVAGYKKAMRLGIGIDTDFFTPPRELPDPSSILFLGRLDPVKKADVFVEALARIFAPFTAHLYGSPTDAASLYAKKIRKAAEPLVARGVLSIRESVPFKETPALYQKHALYVNLTPSGSFDKTIGEAAASGCIIVCANQALKGVVRKEFLADDKDPRDVTRAIEAALHMPPQERAEESQKLRAYVESDHSLSLLARRIRDLFKHIA